MTHSDDELRMKTWHLPMEEMFAEIERLEAEVEARHGEDLLGTLRARFVQGLGLPEYIGLLRRADEVAAWNDAMQSKSTPEYEAAAAAWFAEYSALRALEIEDEIAELRREFGDDWYIEFVRRGRNEDDD